MNNKINEIGNKYGRLLIVDPAPSVNGKAYWLCRCDCGNEHTAMGKLLRAGKVKSCGCWLVDNPPRLLPDDLGRRRRHYRDYRKGAKSRNYGFNISFECFENLVLGPCHYCGKSPSSGVDRKNNVIGYIVSNCVSCCWDCNRTKSTTDYDEFIRWLDRVTSFRGKNVISI